MAKTKAAPAAEQVQDGVAVTPATASTEAAAATTAATAKAAKTPPVQTTVKMKDGRDVVFIGKRRMLKESKVSDDGSAVTTTFDFVNGETISITVPVAAKLAPRLIGHGLEQKIGDETAGDETVEDMILHVQSVVARLNGGAGEWGAERGTGDSFSGASVVIKALCEATGKDLAFIKDYLEKKLAADKANGGTLTRQKLYASFRAPGTKTAAIIERLEKDKLAKEVALNADDELASIAAAG